MIPGFPNIGVQVRPDLKLGPAQSTVKIIGYRDVDPQRGIPTLFNLKCGVFTAISTQVDHHITIRVGFGEGAVEVVVLAYSKTLLSQTVTDQTAPPHSDANAAET